MTLTLLVVGYTAPKSAIETAVSRKKRPILAVFEAMTAEILRVSQKSDGNLPFLVVPK